MMARDYPATLTLTLTLFFAPQLLPAQTWRDISSDGDAPSPRINAGAVYDPAEHRMIVYGGRGSGGDVDDMWALDLVTHAWSPIQQTSDAGPGPRFTHNMLYDGENRQLILWSGRHTTTTSVSFNDVWTFDINSGRWTLQAPAGDQPNVRYGTAAVFDPRSQQLVNFAGFTDRGRFDDTWRFTVDSSEWVQIDTGGMQPGQRCLHMASYDSRQHRMLMFGGAGAPTGRWDDLWAFDLNAETWSDLSSAGGPSGRSFPTHVYDPVDHRALLFGGSPTGAQVSAELWSFDLETNRWELLAAGAEGPTAREGAVAVHVPSEGRMILFGGRGDDGNLNDVWSLDGLGMVPTAVEHQQQALPVEPALAQNFPNPFNASTVIPYHLAAPGPIRIAIFDVVGRHVKTLLENARAAGSHTIAWDGTDRAGESVASGIYLYRLESGRPAHRTATASRKLVLLR